MTMKDPSKCTHSRHVEGAWVEYDEEMDTHRTGYWEEGYQERTIEDIDLHRYRCTQCGTIFYYSDAAERHYEEGEHNNVTESIENGENERYIRDHIKKD